MSVSIDNPSVLIFKPFIAHSLDASKRQEIGIHALSGNTPIIQIAKNSGVSRKFVYEQKEKALQGVVKAFFETPSKNNDEVLFTIRVTKKWLCQVILALLFICRASYQNVQEFLRDIFDYTISKGTVHNIVRQFLEKAKEINQQQDLTQITDGLHDEIYQAGDPVLVGCCARSTFCYLLRTVDTCDANSWGVHLLDLKEQGLNPNRTIIDGGPSARKGQEEAWSDVPAHGDTFHALKPFSELVRYVDNRAMDAMQEVENFKRKIERPRGKFKEDHQQLDLQKKLVNAIEDSEKALKLSEDLTTLYRWLQKDILSLIGPHYEDRKELLHFIVEELRMRETLCRHKIEPVHRYLENHADNLLEFVPILEMKLYGIAQELEISIKDVWEMYQLRGLPSSDQRRWERLSKLHARMGHNFFSVQSRVNEAIDDTFRANSLVENLNSRLRTYFTLRREVGNEYLEILQYFLNHRRFMRSEYSERVGKSPCELLTGKTHQHWLELLGFELFKQAA